MKTFHLPDLGEGLAEAEIRQWYVKEGDSVTVDQPLAALETAKAVVDVPSPYAGKIAKLYGSVNDVIPTGAPLVDFVTEATSTEQAKGKGSVVGALEESDRKWQEGDMIIGTQPSSAQQVKALPVVRALAKQLQIDLSKVTPTGLNGQIVAEDVKRYAAQSAPMVTAHRSGEMHSVQRTMARLMAQAHQEVAAATIMDDVDITGLAGGDITVRLLQAMAVAAKAEPALNAWFDAKNIQCTLFSEVNIGLAMDTPEGLFVPVLKAVEQMSDKALRAKIEEFKQSVRARTIAPADMQGATVSLSNFGTIAGKYATPMIVPPAVAILGCGRYYTAVQVKEGSFVPRQLLPLSLTFDHRAVTGGQASRYLAAVINFMSA